MIEGNVHPNPSAPYDANDPEAVKRKEIEALRREKESREVLLTLLQTRPGRSWMFSLLQDCHVYQTSFSAEPMTMAFREGERNVGLRLISMIHSVSPEALTMMMSERGQA